MKYWTNNLKNMVYSFQVWHLNNLEIPFYLQNNFFGAVNECKKV